MDEITWKKRRACLLTILPIVATTGVAASIPTPTLETPKQMAVAAADFGMCLRIYAIYFDAPPTDQSASSSVKEILGVTGEAGWNSILVSQGLSQAIQYIGLKFGQGLIDEASNFGGPLFWFISGAMSSSATLLLGLAFMSLCEEKLQKRSAEFVKNFETYEFRS